MCRAMCVCHIPAAWSAMDNGPPTMATRRATPNEINGNLSVDFSGKRFRV